MPYEEGRDENGSHRCADARRPHCVALGMTQDRLLVGDAHWVIQVLHLLVGLGGMGLAGALAARIRHTRVQVLQP